MVWVPISKICLLSPDIPYAHARVVLFLTVRAVFQFTRERNSLESSCLFILVFLIIAGDPGIVFFLLVALRPA